MNLKKHANIILFIIFLLALAAVILIFSPKNSTVPQRYVNVNEELSLDTDITVRSVEELDNGLIRVSYNYFIFNSTDSTVNTILAQNNLNDFFDEYGFNIVSFSSTLFDINQEFNGVDDIDLLTGSDSLASQEGGRIDMTLEFDPRGERGPFNNTISVTASLPPETNEGSPGDSENEDTGNPSTNPDTSNPGNEGNDEVGDGGDDSENPNPDENGNDEDDGNESETDPDPIIIDTPPVTEEEPEIDYTDLTLLYNFIDVNGQVIGIPFSSEPINLEQTGDISLQATPSFSIPGSIRFTIQETGDVTTRNGTTYQMRSPSVSGQPWNVTLGAYSILVEVFEQDNASGDIVYSEMVSLSTFREERTVSVSGEASISFELSPSSNEANPPSEDSEDLDEGNDNVNIPDSDGGRPRDIFPDDEELTPNQNDPTTEDNQTENDTVNDSLENDVSSPTVGGGSEPDSSNQEGSSINFNIIDSEIDAEPLPAAGIFIRKAVIFGFVSMLIAFDLECGGILKGLLKRYLKS